MQGTKDDSQEVFEENSFLELPQCWSHLQDQKHGFLQENIKNATVIVKFLPQILKTFDSLINTNYTHIKMKSVDAEAQKKVEIGQFLQV